MTDLLGLENLEPLPSTEQRPNPYVENGRQIIRVASKTVKRSKRCRCLFDDRIRKHTPALAKFRDKENDDMETWLEVKIQKFPVFWRKRHNPIFCAIARVSPLVAAGLGLWRVNYRRSNTPCRHHGRWQLLQLPRCGRWASV